MIGKLVKSVFGSKNDRELKRMGKLVKRINELEPELEALSDTQLKLKSTEFKERFQKGETLDSLLPEAFAAAREASRRALGMRHFDVQLIGGITLHEGRIAEMRTGEGKTLMSTLAAYLNALSGKGVHIVTVNDYLASRDAEWMRPLYEALGLKVGVIQSMQDPVLKHEAYQADITYGTNNEFGFDYLRDNMALRLEDKMQRPLNFAIVDEVDSILIDEARTPLIISGAAEDSSRMYQQMNLLIPKLSKQLSDGEEITLPGDYILDEKSRTVELTEAGHQKVEDMLIEVGLLQPEDSLYSAMNLNLLHHVHAALKAHVLFQRDVDYIIQDNQVVLVDEHTGRTMPGRRLSEGLHQAIEAKEGVSIQNESQTLASTTFQNYFRLFPKLSGMTGTADTEAFEFRQTYGLDVVVIPTNKPIARKDYNDLVYLTTEEKFQAIAEAVKELQEEGKPVLVGTASVEASEEMSSRLKKAGIKHQVLNAKFHEKEASIIAQAGRPGAVTIATNMAGRGTDIVLGGNFDAEVAEMDNPSEEQIEKAREAWKKRNAEVLEAGGLHIIGTERHESRRIDNQLRGRAGRQGDPGMSRFYLSMEDNLMRIFASDRVRGFMQALGMENGEAIEHRMVTNAIEKAQRKVEGRNFDIRKQLLEYDDVANDQRQVVYQQRNELLESDDIAEAITAIRYDVVVDTVAGFIPPQSLEEQWDIPGLEQHLESDFGLRLPIGQWLEEDKKLHEESLRDRILEELQKAYDEKCERFGPVMREVERQIMLNVLDMLWKEHLANMDHLRQGIGLRAFAQKNPKQEYKRESFELFQQMLDNLKTEVIRMLARVEPVTEEEMTLMEEQRRQAMELEQKRMQLEHAQASGLAAAPEADAMAEAGQEGVPEAKPFVRENAKIGRNDACPCGSGKKFKQCHGRLG
ncbi:preprotein translocase subunit SecA [Aestuariicella sp. G3-2]|uniref:preprotein translocase subunit SecA n=1 Tax=Pseudomaricurvus albidus TaxID=2842452 RepID=UPI001C0E1B53|nr:preprotein translocase subunit SecA [Aestuariicella albida]MBU3071013.1 preprotein translocase subunit SecA [Aestuariicella albida]